ncbi:MAG: RNA 2',3'-cyclic phosphodiesterase [Candidatus Brocadiia bacterium]
MRLFVAITLDESVRQALIKAQAELRQSGVDARWVEPVNIHLTMRFLGEVPESMVSKLAETLVKACSGHRAFSMEIVGLGAFPPACASHADRNVSRPRVVWAGCRELKPVLPALYRDIETGILGMGLPGDDKTFLAHITLGRVKSGKNVDKLATVINSNNSKSFGIQAVSGVTLFESKLTPDGPIYREVEKFKLG